MTRPESESTLEDYLSRLQLQTWPRPMEPDATDLLDELRDHLLCDIEQQVTDGAQPRSAEARALAGFGPADRVAGALRVELVRPHLRRLSLALLLLGLAGGATWVGVLLAGPAEPWTDRTEPRTILFFDRVGEFAGTATLLVAALAALLIGCTGRIWRYPRMRAGAQRWSLRACWVSLTLGLLTAAQLGGYLLVRGVIAPTSLAWPAVLTTVALTVAGAPLLFGPLRTVAELQTGRRLLGPPRRR
jgi:hypothetical protein